MAIYAIGDVQGCFDALRRLLDRLAFDSNKDTLWFAGDLVNRGPESLEVLRFVRSLPNTVAVLGNHDLHLLAVASGQAPVKKRDTLSAILEASDRDEILDWLRSRPLLHVDKESGTVLVHAGLLPDWSVEDAIRLAREAETYIRKSGQNELFRHMYGDSPSHWQEDLAGWARVRIVINVFTRLRYCDRQGGLDLRPKMAPGDQPAGLVPWFDFVGRRSRDYRILFGHWSTLGYRSGPGYVCLDSGCLWGGSLSAVRVDGGMDRIEVQCEGRLIPETQSSP